MFASLLLCISNVFLHRNPLFHPLIDTFSFTKNFGSLVKAWAAAAPSEQQGSVLQCSALRLFVFFAASFNPRSNFHIFVRLLLKGMVAPLNSGKSCWCRGVNEECFLVGLVGLVGLVSASHKEAE